MDLVSRWIEATVLQLSGKALAGETEDAVIRLYELSSDEPDIAVEVISQIIDRTVDEPVLNCLGAGPIEELLIKHPQSLEQLIKAVADSKALEMCLTHVNANDGSKLAAQLHEFLAHNRQP